MRNNYHWIGGKHAVNAAILNPNRKKYDIIFLEKFNIDEKNLEKIGINKQIIKKENIKFFNKIFPSDFKHQGVAVRVSTLPKLNLKEYLINHPDEKNIVLLDGITDPRNIGAIIRNCIAFNISSIILHEQGLNLKSPTLHIAASGAIEHANLIVVKNIFSSLKLLKENNYWVFGFDSHGQYNFTKNIISKKNIFIFGDEGAGMKELTKKSCDQIVHIPISNKIESLNVSSAVASALSLLL